MFTKFRKNEEGAVTVDWVVLTAAIVLLAVGLVAALGGTLSEAVCDIRNNISAGSCSS